MRALFIVSLVLFATRLWAWSHVGFGDSEALYASWAVHPQPAYLDHPGLIGLVARAIGEGAVPTPRQAHLLTAIVATLFPWLVVLGARASGAEKRHAWIAGLVVALVPEIAVGLFALTPDLAVAPLWLGAIALAIVGLRARPSTETPTSETIGSIALLGAGLFAGIAASAKVSGLLLMAALAVAYVHVARSSDTRSARVARSLWPWAGLVAGAVIFVPIALFEARTGFPMLRHRWVDTQQGAGVAFGNLAALVGGQLLYLSPIVAVLACIIGHDLVRRRNDDDVARILFWTFALPLAPLLFLSVWSPVAEPHWLAPALLALPIHAARRAPVALLFVRRGLVRAALVSAGALTAVAHAYVLVPEAARLLPPTADPKLDIASELYGWPQATDAITEQMRIMATRFDPEGREVVVVGPHWTVCAQIHAALPGVRVGCATKIPDDFDRWLPRESWRAAESVLFVTDNRFPGDGAEELPAMARVGHSRARILRGGRTSRVFEFYLYSRRQQADLLEAPRPTQTATQTAP